jgi:hypothetical protein
LKLICPKCECIKNIGDAGRYFCFRCDSCDFRFRGIHAKIHRVSYFLNAFFNPFAVADTVENWNRDICPYCAGIIYYGEPARRFEEFIPPSRCNNCMKDLPTSPAIQYSWHSLDDERVVEVFNKIRRKYSGDSYMIAKSLHEWLDKRFDTKNEAIRKDRKFIEDAISEWENS